MNNIEIIIGDVRQAISALASNRTNSAEVNVATRALGRALSTLGEAMLDAKSDPLTAAYIGYGFKKALADSLEYNPDDFGGEDGFMRELCAYADDLDAEWDRRYGENGVQPHGADFIFSYEIAEPFGEGFAKLLAKDKTADAKPFIKQLFDSADPAFREVDIQAIKESLFEDALDCVSGDDSFIREILFSGHIGLNQMSERELVTLYQERFDDIDPLPMIGDDDATKEEPASSTDPAIAA